MSRLSRSAFLSLAPKGQVEWMELDFDGRTLLLISKILVSLTTSQRFLPTQVMDRTQGRLKLVHLFEDNMSTPSFEVLLSHSLR